MSDAYHAEYDLNADGTYGGQVRGFSLGWAKSHDLSVLLVELSTSHNPTPRGNDDNSQ